MRKVYPIDRSAFIGIAGYQLGAVLDPEESSQVFLLVDGTCQCEFPCQGGHVLPFDAQLIRHYLLHIFGRKLLVLVQMSQLTIQQTDFETQVSKGVLIVNA